MKFWLRSKKTKIVELEEKLANSKANIKLLEVFLRDACDLVHDVGNHFMVHNQARFETCKAYPCMDYRLITEDKTKTLFDS
jgi:hypothetical protein